MAITTQQTDIFIDKSGPKDDTAGYNPNNSSWVKKKIGSYKIDQISTNPFEVKISGNYNTSLAPLGSGGDAKHSFESRRKDKFGGQMNTITNEVLKKIYTEVKINPKVTLINITIDTVVLWELTIKQSDDDKAYIGISSRGGAGDALKRKDIDQNVTKKKADLPGEIGEKKIDFFDIIDYKNSAADIRQVFFAYTSPTKYPAYPAGSLPQNDQSQSNDQNAKIAADKLAVANKSAKEGRLVNSKIILKKVSGPGEIVGVTELDLELGSAIFKGLQFTEGGDYVVSVSGSSAQIVPTEFSITVAAAEEVVEQESSGQEEPISGTRPIIAQIDQPTKKLDPMINTQPADNQPGEEITGTLGNLPFVYYSGNQIRPMDIQNLSIYYDQFVPRCVLTFGDSLGLVNAPDSTPTSNSTIEIFLDSGSEQLKSIHLKFLIDQKKDNKNGTITIFGKLDLKDFYKVGFESLSGSSFEVLRVVSKKLQLGYNSNITQTNDAMNWVRNGVNAETYIRGIIDNSYISDDSFMAAYIDYYYCFNYVDVEKEYNRDNSLDVAISSTGLGSKVDQPDEAKISSLYLTNAKGHNSSPYYFSKFNFINSSTAKITTKGTTTDSKVYDRVNKRFLNFKVDSMASTDPTLKTLRSKDDIDTNFTTEFSGKLDTDNVHENYLYALTQNQRNLTNLGNIMADLTLPIPNFNIYKFQKISIIFINDKSTPTEPDKIITRYTGNWIIIDISFIYQKGQLFQTLRVARKELSKTLAEINTQVTTPDNSQNSELNENPVLDPEPVIPNSIYEVGQEVYLEQNGRMYIVKIDRVAENGLEVSGKIQQSTIGVPFGYQTITPGLSASTITPIVMTPSVASNAVDAEIKAVASSSLGIYSGQGNEIITATVPFLINDGSKEFIGIGTASLSQAGGVVAQKEVAFKLAEIDAIKKYKAG